MFEVRFHGRGGQGAVLAAQALATAAFLEGKYAVAFPHFGAERRGAPVQAFARFDERKIRLKTRVYEPDAIVVLDNKLATYIDVAQGLRVRGVVVMNSSLDPGEVELSQAIDLATVDATGIALEHTGKPVTNAPMLGAFAAATSTVAMDSVKRGIMEVFSPRIGEDLAKKNAEAAQAAFGVVARGRSRGGKTYPAMRQWLPEVEELPLGLATGILDTESGPVGPGSFSVNETGTWRDFAPILDPEECTNCLLCWFFCPDGAILRGGEELSIDYYHCKGCGICAQVCPTGAILMRPTEEVVA